MTVGETKNPFRPGVGTRPLYLAGREGPLKRFEAMLRAAPEQPANMRLTGLRGVGKTVLLGEFAVRAETREWASISIELQPGHNRESSLVDAINGEGAKLRARLSLRERVLRATNSVVKKALTAVKVEYADITIGLEPTDAAKVANLTRTLADLVEFVTDHGEQGLLLLLDEAQTVRDETSSSGQHPLSLLITAVVALQRAEVPLGLVLCGLPTLKGNLMKARSYTERMFRGEEIGSLASAEAHEALTKPFADTPVSPTEDLVQAVIDEVEGYPFFVQLWGAELWDAATLAGVEIVDERLLREVTPEIYRRLDSDFYEPRVSTLTPAEQDLLLGTASCSTYPPLAVGEINGTSEKRPGNINVLLGRLVEAGVLYRVRKGQYDYTAPKFREFLERRAARS
jgi:hypothetical protein